MLSAPASNDNEACSLCSCGEENLYHGGNIEEKKNNPDVRTCRGRLGEEEGGRSEMDLTPCPLLDMEVEIITC